MNIKTYKGATKMTEKELLIQFLNKLQLKGGENLSGYFEICNDEGGFIEEITFAFT